MSHLLVNSEDLSLTTSYTFNEDLLDNTQYHWQVTAEDQSGATYSTPLQSFTVNVENDLPSDFALFLQIMNLWLLN